MTDYGLLKQQAEELTKDNIWDITVYANISALIYESLDDINWAGFYLLRDGVLLLGPFQGKPACTQIPVGKGVCGTAVKNQQSIRVADVHNFPGHIACDSASESEIVIPFYHDDKIIGVLDIDSPIKDRFKEEDEAGLESIIRVIEKNL
jgi:GAF domain-containing protein